MFLWFLNDSYIKQIISLNSVDQLIFIIETRPFYIFEFLYFIYKLRVQRFIRDLKILRQIFTTHDIEKCIYLFFIRILESSKTLLFYELFYIT